MLSKIHYKDQCSKVSQTRKVKCPKEKKEKEAKYTLAFHAKGKKSASRFSWKMNITSNYIFKKEGANSTGANDGVSRWVVSNDSLKICQKWTCHFPHDAKVHLRLRSIPDHA